MKFASKMNAVLRTAGNTFALLLHVVALVLQVLMFVTNIAALTFTAAGTCFLLFVFYRATGDSLFVPVVLALVIAGAVSYEIYDRRHGWRPVYLKA